ncbi:hypothetical protein [Dyella silvatica]|uniref:hypothetical protein n=1 Tax=Dyella silvatica TaxID=2992128 RepID=UPI00224EC243|nr:hypothetical protein [Dyella silvatica]
MAPSDEPGPQVEGRHPKPIAALRRFKQFNDSLKSVGAGLSMAADDLDAHCVERDLQRTPQLRCLRLIDQSIPSSCLALRANRSRRGLRE